MGLKVLGIASYSEKGIGESRPNGLRAVARHISHECGEMTKTGLLMAFDNISTFNLQTLNKELDAYQEVFC